MIELRKGNIPGTDLQRDHNIDQTDEKRHRHEEDHVGAVGREELVEMIGGEKPSIEGDRLVDPHQDPLNHPAEEHDHREDDIHRADFFVIDTRQPIEKGLPPLHPKKKSDDQRASHRHHSRRTGGDEGVQIGIFKLLDEDDRIPCQSAKKSLEHSTFPSWVSLGRPEGGISRGRRRGCPVGFPGSYPQPCSEPAHAEKFSSPRVPFRSDLFDPRC